MSLLLFHSALLLKLLERKLPPRLKFEQEKTSGKLLSLSVTRYDCYGTRRTKVRQRKEIQSKTGLRHLLQPNHTNLFRMECLHDMVLQVSRSLICDRVVTQSTQCFPSATTTTQKLLLLLQFIFETIKLDTLASSQMAARSTGNQCSFCFCMVNTVTVTGA